MLNFTNQKIKIFTFLDEEFDLINSLKFNYYGIYLISTIMLVYFASLVLIYIKSLN